MATVVGHDTPVSLAELLNEEHETRPPVDSEGVTAQRSNILRSAGEGEAGCFRGHIPRLHTPAALLGFPDHGQSTCHVSQELAQLCEHRSAHEKELLPDSMSGSPQCMLCISKKQEMEQEKFKS